MKRTGFTGWNSRMMICGLSGQRSIKQWLLSQLIKTAVPGIWFYPVRFAANQSQTIIHLGYSLSAASFADRN